MRDQFTEIGKVTVATDLSDAANDVVDWGLLLARQFGAAVELVYVLGATATVPDTLASEGARAKLEELAERCSRMGVPVQSRVLAETQETHRAIIDAATAFGADLIVVGTHGRRGLRRLTFGSVAEGVLRHAAVPVMAVPMH